MRLLDRLFGKATDATVEGYCFKCRVTRAMKNPAEVSAKNSRLMVQGVASFLSDIILGSLDTSNISMAGIDESHRRQL